MFDWIELIINGLLTIVFGIIGITQWRREMIANVGFKITPIYEWKKNKDKKIKERKGYNIEIFNNSNRDIYDFSITLKDKHKWCNFKGKYYDDKLPMISENKYTDLPMGQSFKWFLMREYGVDNEGEQFLDFTIEYKVKLWKIKYKNKKHFIINAHCFDMLEYREEEI